VVRASHGLQALAGVMLVAVAMFGGCYNVWWLLQCVAAVRCVMLVIAGKHDVQLAAPPSSFRFNFLSPPPSARQHTTPNNLQTMMLQTIYQQ